MLPRVTRVRHVADYRLELTFTDGTRAELDSRNKVAHRGGMFTPLEDIDFFRQVRVDPEPAGFTGLAGKVLAGHELDLA